MAPLTLVKLNGKYLLNQQDQDLSSWGISVYRENNSSSISCVLNSSNSSDFKGISLDLQLCKWQENQTPERKKERPLSGFVDFLGEGKKVQTVVCVCVWVVFFFFFLFFSPTSIYLHSMVSFIIGFQPYTSTFWSHVQNIYLFLIFLALAYKNF